MATLSASQIAGYAKGAGFTGNDVAIAVAVALAESSGQTNVTHKNLDGSTDHGLWQINSVHKDLLASGSWSDPADNAHMAYRVWKSSGWRAWTTYNTGAYVTHLASARKAANSASAVGGGVGGDAAADVITAKSDTTGRITQHGPYGQGGAPPYPTAWVGESSVASDGDAYVQISPTRKVRVKQDGSYVDGTRTITNEPVIIGRMKSWLLKEYKPKPGQKTHDVYDTLKKTNEYNYIKSTYIASASRFGDQSTYPHSSIEGVLDVLTFLFDPHNWLRVAMFVAGAILVLLAAYKAADISVPGPVGAVVKAVA